MCEKKKSKKPLKLAKNASTKIALDRNKRIIKELVFLFHPSPPLFSHLAAVRVSPQPAMASTQTLQSARNKDEAEWKSNDRFGLNRIVTK